MAKAINDTWGSFDGFKAEMEKQAVALFGSGWTWLAKDASGALVIKNTANGGNPVKDGLEPLWGFDVWEHAYLLDNQILSADHLKAMWGIIGCKAVGERF